MLDGVNGALDEDLKCAIERALTLDRAQCRRHAQDNTWEVVAQRLSDNLASIDWRDFQDARAQFLR